MFILYQLILTLVILISPLIILFRIIKNKEHKKRFIEKFFLKNNNKKKENILWFHGASVGEVMSIIPLIQFYEKNKLIDKILITSSTLSSSKLFEKYNFKKTIHRFYPIDHFLFVKSFLNYWKPKIAIFIDSEIWPCMYNDLNKKNIPIILLNARITNKTYNKWLLVNHFARLVFKNIKIAYPQNNETKNYLKKLKVRKIKSIGNIKFLKQKKNKHQNTQNINFKEFKRKKIWIASSTHYDEEITCIKSHLELRKKIDNLMTIIIPRHIDRVKNIKYEINKLGLNVTLHSQKKSNLNDVDIYIVDTIGETEKFYKIAPTIFMGKSLQNFKKGGQNPIEPARFGAKILHGPNVSNFKEVYKLLKVLKISKLVKNQTQLTKEINFKKNKNITNKIDKIGLKTFEKVKKELDNLINHEFKKT